MACVHCWMAWVENPVVRPIIGLVPADRYRLPTTCRGSDSTVQRVAGGFTYTGITLQLYTGPLCLEYRRFWDVYLCRII